MRKDKKVATRIPVWHGQPRALRELRRNYPCSSTTSDWHNVDRIQRAEKRPTSIPSFRSSHRPRESLNDGKSGYDASRTSCSAFESSTRPFGEVCSWHSCGKLRIFNVLADTSTTYETAVANLTQYFAPRGNRDVALFDFHGLTRELTRHSSNIIDDSRSKQSIVSSPMKVR